MSHIITRSGIRYSLVYPDPNTISLLDVAHALSRLCRFTGHTPRHYSVAEHSVRCWRVAASMGASITEQRAVLMHDAHEAYIGDMSSPLKRCVETQRFEKKHKQAMALRFKLPLKDPVLVHEIDLALLATEFRDLFGLEGVVSAAPLPEKISNTEQNYYQDFLDAAQRMDIV